MKLENGNEITTINTSENIRGKRALLNPYDDAMSDIKPCPFCGSEAKEEVNGTFHAIVCQNYECGAEVNSFKQKDKAIEVWNHRV